MKNKRWSKEEINRMNLLIEQGYTIKKVAHIIGRSTDAVRVKANRLKRVVTPVKINPDDDLEILKEAINIVNTYPNLKLEIQDNVLKVFVLKLTEL